MKTNFFKSMKLVLFLLSAVFSSYVGIAQTTQPNVVISPIGGKKNPDPTPFTNQSITLQSCSIVFLDMGGKSFSGAFTTNKIGGRSLEPKPISMIVVIGGKQSPGPVLLFFGKDVFKDQRNLSLKPPIESNFPMIEKILDIGTFEGAIPLLV